MSISNPVRFDRGDRPDRPTGFKDKRRRKVRLTNLGVDFVGTLNGVGACTEEAPRVFALYNAAGERLHRKWKWRPLRIMRGSQMTRRTAW
jgi:hypothetical protein